MDGPFTTFGFTIAHGLCAPQYSYGGSLHGLQFTLPTAISVKKLQLDLEALLYSRTVTNVESNQLVEKIHFGCSCTLSLTVKTCNSGLVPHQKIVYENQCSFCGSVFAAAALTSLHQNEISISFLLSVSRKESYIEIWGTQHHFHLGQLLKLTKGCKFSFREANTS